MSPPLKCRLRTLRRGWSLSQEDLASLIPGCGRNRIGRLEHGLSEPSASELTACGLIFGLSAFHMFPYFYGEAANTVKDGVQRLRQKYEPKTSPKAKQRIKLFDQIHERVITSTNQK